MKFLNGIFFSIVALSLVSCSSPDSLSNGQKTKLRIVDLQGHAHAVKMRTPELNVQALTAQGKISEEVLNSQSPKTTAGQSADYNNKYSDNNFAGNSNDALRNTMQLPEDPQRMAQARAERPRVSESDIITAGNSAKNQEEEVEINLADNTPKDKPVKATKTNNSAKNAAAASAPQKGIFVQTGSFSILQNAKISLEQVEKIAGKSSIKIEEVVHENKTVYRVLIGPFPNKQKASAMIAKLAKSNQQAIIVRNK